MEDFVGIRIDRLVQPELLTVEADHLFINRELIRGDCRDRLQISLMNPVMNSDMTPIDPKSFREISYLA